jgi:hypothetical protein
MRIWLSDVEYRAANAHETAGGSLLRG